MSKTNYKRLSHVYYTTAWSILKDGKRVWVYDKTFSKTPEAAFEETKGAIQYSNREDFKVVLAGWRIL